MDDARDHQPKTPRTPLFPPATKVVDLRRHRVDDAEVRDVLGRAAVEVAGQVGYAHLTVDRTIERAGVSRPVFYRHFIDRERCYVHGYSQLAPVLVDLLLESCEAAGSWRSGLAAALGRLDDFVVGEEELASGLIAQVLAAGGEALDIHDRLGVKLTSALERTGPEARKVSPPPSAAAFVLAAIESTAVGALGASRPEEFAVAIPSLLFLAGAILLDVDSKAEG